jgi:hypothetical protein
MIDDFEGIGLMVRSVEGNIAQFLAYELHMDSASSFCKLGDS